MAYGRSIQRSERKTSAKEIMAPIPDELISAVVYRAILGGGAIMFGQTRNKTAVSIRVYEDNSPPSTQYANTTEELVQILIEVDTYFQNMDKDPEVIRSLASDAFYKYAQGYTPKA